MNWYGYGCLGGIEFANDSRFSAYLRNGLLGAFYQANCDECEAVTDGDVYASPASDPAPWYDPQLLGSDEFLGLGALEITVGPVLSRSMASSAVQGGVLSPVRLGPRTVTVSGLLGASSPAGMAYGQRWLNEVLSGSYCEDGGGDELVLLPVCPEASYLPVDRAFRMLVGAGIVQGPEISKFQNFPFYKVTQVAFQLSASEPYLFGLAEEILSGTITATTDQGAFSVPEWVDGAAFVIDITNDTDSTVEDVVVTGRISLDGSCPVSGDAASVPPSWTYTIPTMEAGARIVIDGRRNDALWYDPSCKEPSSGLPHMTFDGPFKNAEIGPCTTACVSIDVGTGEVEAVVNAHLREK